MSNIGSVDVVPQYYPHAFAAVLANSPEVTRGDIARLEAHFFGVGTPSRRDIESLFALDRAPIPKCPQWTTFFVEAVTDYVVWQVRPTGILGDEIADWLMETADLDNTVNALAVLVNVLAEAERVPRGFLTALKARAAQGWPGIDQAIDAMNREGRLAA